MRLQASLHSSLIQLQERVAGLAPQSALAGWFTDHTIDAQEYVNTRVASGAEEDTAINELIQIHAAANNPTLADPSKGVIEATIPQYSLPKRIARKPPREAMGLRGHPLD